MKRIQRYAVLTIILVSVLVLVVRNRYVLDSQKLHTAIVAQLPPGTHKTQVIRFIQARKPLFYDDEGTHVKARLTGLAGNLIYRKDIVLDFEFDPNGGLLACTEKEFLTFL
jgi:hypothetical protein